MKIAISLGALVAILATSTGTYLRHQRYAERSEFGEKTELIVNSQIKQQEEERNRIQQALVDSCADVEMWILEETDKAIEQARRWGHISAADRSDYDANFLFNMYSQRVWTHILCRKIEGLKKSY